MNPAFTYLESTDQMQQLIPILKNEDLNLVTFIAKNLLPYYEDIATTVLNDIINANIPHTSFNAKIILDNWLNESQVKEDSFEDMYSFLREVELNNSEYKLSDKNVKILLMQIHEIIQQNISFALKCLDSKDKTSFDNYVFTDKENDLINTLKGIPEFKGVLKKIVENSMDTAFFNFLCILDGVADPDPKFGKWKDVILIECPDTFDEDVHYFKEQFHPAYDDWEKLKKESS